MVGQSNQPESAPQQPEVTFELTAARLQALVGRGCAAALLAADGTLLYATPAIQQVLGYAPEEVVGRSVFTWLHPDDSARATALFAQLLQAPGTTVAAQLRLQHRDGSWRWIEGTATNLLADPEVQAILASYRDITALKQAEESLRLLSQVVEHTTDSIVICDSAGGEGYYMSIHPLQG